MFFQILYFYTLLMSLLSKGYQKSKLNSMQNHINHIDEQIYQPIVGILSLPSGFQKYDHQSFSYIYDSYVQYFQQTGAKIIPLKYTSSLNFLKNKMYQINGLVIPGGGANLMYRNNESGDKEFTKFAEVGEYLISIAKQLNNEGKYFPVWGTCLGFELLVLSFTKTEVRDQFQGENHFGGFFLSPNNTQKSRLFKHISFKLKQQIKYQQEIFYFNHKYGFKVNKFIKNGLLKESFIPLAYSLDLNGKKFVAIAEAKQYPFYGIQFHPEKLQFEWSQQNTNQPTINEISIVKYFSDFFYKECLKNSSKFRSNLTLEKSLIQNYKVVNTKGQEFGFYLFNNYGKDQYIINKNISNQQEKQIQQQQLNESNKTNLNTTKQSQQEKRKKNPVLNKKLKIRENSKKQIEVNNKINLQQEPLIQSVDDNFLIKILQIQLLILFLVIIIYFYIDYKYSHKNSKTQSQVSKKSKYSKIQVKKE